MNPLFPGAKLWTALCGFYNILLQGHGLEAFRASRSEVKQVAALPEDVELWGFLPFRDSHFGLDFSWKVALAILYSDGFGCA